MAGHVAPEAVRGGPIAAVHDGDAITIDVDARRLDVALDDATIAERVAAYEGDDNADLGGVLGKYAKLVSSASAGRHHLSRGAGARSAEPRASVQRVARRELLPVVVEVREDVRRVPPTRAVRSAHSSSSDCE